MRPQRIQQDEYPYHVTTRTNGRKFRLTKVTYKTFLRVMRDTIRKFNVHIHHLKLMDNHYHLMVSTPDANLSAVMHFINWQLAMQINQLQQTCGHLWGERFHACMVDSDAYQQNCILYIYNNGPRAGVCETAADDPRLSTFAFYANGKKIPFTIIEDDFYLLLGATAGERQAAFRQLVAEAQSTATAALVHAGLRRVFYGSGEFLAKMSQRYGAFVRKMDTRPVSM